MLHDRIKDARINARMTQKEVASKIGVAVSTYSGYERGASDPDVSTLCKIMSALSVDANFIYQDYGLAKEKAPEKQELSDNISIEDSTRLLVGLGFIREGEQLTDADIALLSCVFDILDAWFSRERG